MIIMKEVVVVFFVSCVCFFVCFLFARGGFFHVFLSPKPYSVLVVEWGPLPLYNIDHTWLNLILPKERHRIVR